ncbi:MAG: hypothetical protein FJW56_03690 [Actinobacteria bacterium]|nr:hypothetical protein [Actinomycetota bacterium]
MTQEKWVDKLEESTHSFLNSSLEWIEKYRGLRDRSSQLKNPNIEIDRMLNAINSSIIKLQLLLDNNKPDQKCILDNVVEMKHIINDKSFENDSISRLRVCHENIIERLKNIFHEERNKIASIFR